MCRDCTGDCAHDRETDEWIVPADLGKGRDTPTASKTAPLSDVEASRVYGKGEASRRPSAPILRRDGGEGAER